MRVCAPDCCAAKELHENPRLHLRFSQKCGPQQLESEPEKSRKISEQKVNSIIVAGFCCCVILRDGPACVFVSTIPRRACSSHAERKQQRNYTQRTGKRVCRQYATHSLSLSLSLSLSPLQCKCVSVLRLICREIIVREKR